MMLGATSPWMTRLVIVLFIITINYASPSLPSLLVTSAAVAAQPSTGL